MRLSSCKAPITIIDPYTGYIVAMVGGIGEKTADRGWNWATSVRPCGSAAKPISTYAPALDQGIITGASTIDDYPVLELNDSAYPKNDNGRFQGLVTLAPRAGAVPEHLRRAGEHDAGHVGVL